MRQGRFCAAQQVLLSVALPSFGRVRSLEVSGQRVMKLLEVMEEFDTLLSDKSDPRGPGFAGAQPDAAGGDCCGREPRELRSGELVKDRPAKSIEFDRCAIYTPDGMRLLMDETSLSLPEGESCLVMGPSGVGKSSLLRVLGRLWPMFRAPHDLKKAASWTRSPPPSTRLRLSATRLLLRAWSPRRVRGPSVIVPYCSVGACLLSNSWSSWAKAWAEERLLPLAAALHL